MDYEWDIRPCTAEEQAKASQLAQALDISPILGLLLLRRGIETAEQARSFFRPRLACLYNPFLLNDMDKAVMRLERAIERGERILVYGDYDVDGVTAVALVYKFISQFYQNIDYYIPDRYEEGYGVSRQGVDYAAETGVGLVIVLDCGIKAIEAIAYAKAKGVDFIICDHHMPDETLPPAVAVLDAKRRDDVYPFKELSGCGVGFKFMQAFAQRRGIEFSRLTPLLDLLAVSIVSDIVPIMGENRILAFHGMRQLNANPSVGLKALLDLTGTSGREVNTGDIIFKIGPRINASGRMQNAKEAVRLLVEEDPRVAARLASLINHYNDQRKDLDKSLTQEASSIADAIEQEQHHKAIVVAGENWHKGVIGIVASRLTELHHRPAVVLTCQDDGMATGSARSVPGFDVYKAVDSCRDLLEGFGGHTYAAGLLLRREHLAEFRRRFMLYVEEHIQPTQIAARLEIEACIDFASVTPRFMEDLRKFAPFGPENQRPLFCTRQVYDYGTSRVVGRHQEHIKMELVSGKTANVINGIAFGQSSSVKYIKSKRAFDIVYAVEENSFHPGQVQLQITDIRPSLDE